ncbi:MAG: uncharacterized protein KVP18_005197, partial [Porospora cf. gigantea A]|uniref:uncharacterized protein n=1 Tax=Porospora cf. gigantea A TaxID=2853593 RepID=UPI00355A75C8
MLSCLCVFIGVVYFAYAMTCLRPLLFPEVEVAGVVIMAVFHVILSLLLTSLYKVVRTDPGPVPPNWGYYVGDEQKRRRYCSACNLWKPDRTHHCSVCNRCTLNMDHHCPWVNNCVGFWNRKFFIQFLLYAILCVGLVSFHGLYFLVVDGYFFWSDIDQDPYRASEEWLAITFYIIFVVV